MPKSIQKKIIGLLQKFETSVAEAQADFALQLQVIERKAKQEMKKMNREATVQKLHNLKQQKH